MASKAAKARWAVARLNRRTEIGRRAKRIGRVSHRTGPRSAQFPNLGRHANLSRMSKIQTQAPPAAAGASKSPRPSETPDPYDFYDFSALLTDEERLIRQTVRDFVEREVLPDVEEHFRAGTFPQKLIPRLAGLGLLGPTVPEEYGGSGLGATAYGLIMLELERGDSGLRSFASVQGSLVMYPILRYGSEEQRRHWLPRLAAGVAIRGTREAAA